MRNRGLRIAGDPVWARYNPPFAPWFLRRNEILVPVDGDGSLGAAQNAEARKPEPR